jgi:hypothetical protein
MSNKLTLHIQQNTTLERVAIILDFLRNKETNFEQLGATCNLGAFRYPKGSIPIFAKHFNYFKKKSTLTDTSWWKLQL